MKKRTLFGRGKRSTRRRSRSTARRRPPVEPVIVAGKFKGQKLSELSDEELIYFLRCDAQSQTRDTVPSFLSRSLRTCLDFSQYWFARYELERRKVTSGRESTSSFKLTANDTNEIIASRLVNYGYRLAALKYHPDVGGENRSMQQLTAARDYALNRLTT